MATISWTPFVFIRYLFFLVAGILFQIYFKAEIEVFFVITGLSFLCFLSLFFLLKKHHHYRYPYLFGISGGIFLFSIGVISVFKAEDLNSPLHIRHIKEKILWYQARVDTEVIEKKKSFRTEVELLAVKTETGWKPAIGRVMVFLIKKDSLIPLDYGDEFIASGSPFEIPGPMNPGDFDYKSFLNHLQIYHQHFLKKYQIIKRDTGNPIISLSLKSRHNSHKIFKQYIHSERELSVASALILGVRADLDDELKKAYSSTGVVHILAVSGMHVCLVFQLLIMTLGKLKEIRYGKFIFGGLALLLIWFYAFVTGLSPSVFRAVVMFTIILTGEAFGRQKSVYNNFFFSAFILLIYNPFLIFNIGFQLSYLAVLGIVVFYSKIYELFDFKNRIKDYFWKIAAVSIAAQIATSPLSILYFHQFPIYFIIANLLLIPIITVALYLGVILLKISFFPFLAVYIGELLAGILWLGNTIIFYIFEIPFSFIAVSLTAFEAILIYFSILFLYLLFQKRQLKYLQYTFLVFAMYSLSDLYNFSQQLNSKRVVVYKGSEHIEFLSGTKTIELSDFKNIKDVSGIKLMSFKSKIIGVSDQPIQNFPYSLNEKIRLDVLIIRNNSVNDLNILLKVFNPDNIVFDDDNDRVTVGKIIANHHMLNRKLHSVAENGAFVLDF